MHARAGKCSCERARLRFAREQRACPLAALNSSAEPASCVIAHATATAAATACAQSTGVVVVVVVVAVGIPKDSRDERRRRLWI